MKKNALVIFIVTVLISACSSSSQTISAVNEPRATTSSVPVTATSTATEIPPAPTLTPTPTVSLPVGFQTPVPSSKIKISPENLAELQEVARYYGQMYFTAALSGDQKLLFVRDPIGIDIYDYRTNEHLNHIDLLGNPSFGEIQVSQEGEWALIDQNWLIHFTFDDEYQIQNLSNAFPLKEGNRYRETRLSLDGHKLLFVEFRCNFDGCMDDHVELIGLPDLQSMYSWDNGDNLDLHGWDATFSPDGSLIAARIGYQVIIWQTSDQTKVTTIKNIQGSAPAVFSSDSSTIAIGQLDTVQIWNISGGEKIQTIKGLCGDLYYPPKPIFLDSKRVVVLECPKRREGVISGWLIEDATAFLKRNFDDGTDPRIAFEVDKNKAVVLENPRETGPWAPSNNPFIIQFLPNGDLAFQENRLCTIKINGKIKCSEGRLLGTDQEVYIYRWQDHCIDFYRGLTANGSPVYTVCSTGFVINALDPINGLLFYTDPSTGGDANLSNSAVIGLENNPTKIAEWKGSEIEKVAFSGDRSFATVCLRPGGALHFDVVDKDKLVLIDLSQKTVIDQQPFTCLNMPTMVLTNDGSKLIAAHGYIGTYGYTWHKLLIMSTTPPFQKEIFDIGCNNFGALALSADESFLVVACTDGTLRFLDPNTAAEIYRLERVDPNIWGLAFSKDGTRLAMASRRGFISEWAIPPFSFKP